MMSNSFTVTWKTSDKERLFSVFPSADDAKEYMLELQSFRSTESVEIHEGAPRPEDGREEMFDDVYAREHGSEDGDEE